MENHYEKDILEKYITSLCNSAKFRKLHRTISKLQSKYLAKGLHQDQVAEKIAGKFFNDKRSLNVNWMNLKNTLEYHKAKNLGDFDCKTIEMALNLNHELSRMKKRIKNTSQSYSEETFNDDDVMDLFQCRLDQGERNSTSGSNSPPELEMNLIKPDTFAKAEFLSSHESSPPYPTTLSMQPSHRSSSSLIKRKAMKQYEQDLDTKKKKIKFNPTYAFDSDGSMKSMKSVETKAFSFKEINESLYMELDSEHEHVNRLKRMRESSDQIPIEKDLFRTKYN